MTQGRILLVAGLALLFPSAAAHADSAPDCTILLVRGVGDVEVLSGSADAATSALDGARHAWAWCRDSAPQKVRIEDLGSLRPSPSSQMLEVRTTGARDNAARLRVVAAPRQMWREVPEPLLPTWDLPRSGRMQVPFRSGEPWRSRVFDRAGGSWWRDTTMAFTVIHEVVRTPVRRFEVVGPDGEPVPHALLRWTVGNETGTKTRILGVYRSDRHGGVELPGVPDRGLDLVGMKWTAVGCAPAGSVGPIDELPKQIRLQAGNTLDGRFRDGEGAAVAGVEVWAETRVPGLPRASHIATAASQDDGSWRIEDLPRGEVRLLARSPGFLPFSSSRSLESPHVDLGELRLVRGVELTALVVDDRGEPVPGASVRAGLGADRTSDREGKAVLTVPVDDDPIRISASAEGHLIETVRLTPAWRERPVLRLVRAFEVGGRFSASTGDLARKPHVRIETGSEFRDLAIDPGGTFDLSVPPRVPVTLTFLSENTRALTVQVEPGLPGEQRDLGALLAPDGMDLHGVIFSSLDGAAVPNARIWLPRPSSLGDVVAWGRGDVLATRSDRDGRFALEGVPPRPVLLRVDAPGFARTYLEAGPHEGSPSVDLGSIELSVGSTLEIQLGEDALEDPSVKVDLRGEWLELDMLTARVEGTVAVARHVPPGAATVLVFDGRDLRCEQRIEISEKESERAIDCSRAAMQVSGTVFVGERPFGGGRLLWSIREKPRSGALILDTVNRFGRREQVVFGGGRPNVEVRVAGDGSFHTERLRPGDWEVRRLSDAGDASSAEHVEIPDVDAHHAELRFGGLALWGRVVDSDEQPVFGAQVRLLDQEATAFADQEGRFVLTGLQPGTQRLVARKMSQSSDVVHHELEPSGSVDEVTLMLDPKNEMSLRVEAVGVDDAAASGAFVLVEMDRGGTQMRSTDQKGSALFELSPPYPARVRAAMYRSNQWSLGPWEEVAQPRNGHPVSLQLQEVETGSLRVDGDDAEGFVALRRSDGWSMSELFSRMAGPLLLRPGTPLVVDGLPPGEYVLELGEVQRKVLIDADEIRAVVISSSAEPR